MTNVFMYETTQSTKKILAGNVTDVRFAQMKSKLNPDENVRVAVVEIEDYTKGVWTVFFRNKEATAENPNPPQLADRIDRGRLYKGAFIAVLGYFNEAEKKATGLDYRYAGIFRMVDDNGRELNIIIGNAMRPKWIPATEKFNSDQFTLTIPVTDRDKNTNWERVQFVNSEKVQGALYAKNKYEKAIAPKTLADYSENNPKELLIRKVAVKCGALKEYTGTDGKTYHQYKAFKLVCDTKNAVRPETPPATVPDETPAATTSAESKEVTTDPPFADPKAVEEGFMEVPEDLIDEMAWE